MRTWHMILIVVLTIFMGSQLALVKPSLTPTPLPHGSCTDLDEYVDDVIAGSFYDLPVEDQKLIEEVLIDEDFNPTITRPSKLRRISEAFDEWAGNLEETDSDDIPYAARGYHKFLIDSISLISAATNAIASNGPLADLGFDDEAESLLIRREEINSAGHALCGNAWSVLEGRIEIPPDDRD